MKQKAAESYACVTYHIMKYEDMEQSEEYLGMLLKIFCDFFNEQKIIKIYQQYICFDEFQIILYNENKTNE